MKRISFLVLIVLVITSLTLTSCITTTIPLTYELNEDGNGYVVSAIIKDPIMVVDGSVIPSSHEGLPVTEIKDGGFAGWKNLYCIAIPGTVEKIGSYAFGYSGLSIAMIEEGTKYIDSYAFAYSALSEIALPSTIEYIGEGAFALCYNLSTIVYGGSRADWYSIEKGFGWNELTGNPYLVSVYCTDGIITFYGSDSMTTAQ